MLMRIEELEIDSCVIRDHTVSRAIFLCLFNA
jgi:hypothetical protein